MDDLRLRIQQLLQQLNERVFGKEHVIALSLLSAVAEIGRASCRERV